MFKQEHSGKILRHLVVSAKHEDKKIANLIAGFDLVNEEDFTDPIGKFAEQILQH